MRLCMSPAAVHGNDNDPHYGHHNLCRRRDKQHGSINLVAAIDYLPVELLIQIFVLCTRTSSSFLLPSMTISQVCRFWREISLNTPHIWQYIHLDDRIRPIRASHIQATTSVDRSRSLSLDIHINLADSDNLLPLLSPLLAHVRRWKRVTLTGQLQEEADFASFSQEGSQAILDNLTVSINGLDTPIGPQVPTPRIRTFHCSSPLDLGYTARFHRVAMHAEVFTLPLPQRMTTVHLHSLIVRENSIDVIPDPAEVVRFLQCCPELKVFHYHALPYEPTTSAETGPLPIVQLPRLHTLVLRSTCAVRAILSHIDAPSLRELYLEHTNMEFELRRASAYSLPSEEGDSEDEAHDFSQSPWSDHATGMGLRSLMRRSCPSLEVLQMDYADMRTKDFLWCFDRLDSLQEFRIVASDMSDKVIAMLTPFHQSAATSPGELEERLHVRMPKLSALELWNCQRLTGDAVVDALGARVQYTDKVADRNAYSKLSDVAIVACTNFAPQHAERLAYTLGTRLRTHA